MKMKWQRSQSEPPQLPPRLRRLLQDRPHRLLVSTIADLQAIPRLVKLPTHATASPLYRIVLPPQHLHINGLRAASRAIMAHLLRRPEQHMRNNQANTLVLLQRNRVATARPTHSSRNTTAKRGRLNPQEPTATTVKTTDKAIPKHRRARVTPTNHWRNSSRAHRMQPRIRTTRASKGRQHKVRTSAPLHLPCSHCIPVLHSKANKGPLMRTLARNHKLRSTVSNPFRGERRRPSLRSLQLPSTVCRVHKHLLSLGEQVELRSLRNSNSKQSLSSLAKA